MMVIPSDQAVVREDLFQESVINGLDLVAGSDQILTLGVLPTRPEPGYGYIQIGDLVHSDYIYKVKSFTEKPDRQFAQMFVDSGEFFWNTGIYMANVMHMRQQLHRIFPAVLRKIDDPSVSLSLEDELLYIEENFPSYPNVSIDFGLLDNNKDVCVMKCDFGWADLGMWHSIYESLRKSQDDNVVIGSNVITEDCHDNIIKIPKDHLGVINGLDGYIVAEQGNVLLICKKGDSSALIRKYVNEVQLKYGEEYI